MSRILICCALSVLCLSAQANKSSNSYGATSGFGNVLYPGTGGPPAPNYGIKPIFPARQGGGTRGITPVVSKRTPFVVLPVYFPMPFYIFAPNYSEPQPPQEPPQQPLAVNQNYAPEAPRPTMREYYAGSLPEPARIATEPPAVTKSIDDEKPTIYLIAMKDSTIYSSLAYWVEDNTVHYITTQYSHNRATMELIDTELSIQLNRERGVEFKLPAR